MTTQTAIGTLCMADNTEIPLTTSLTDAAAAAEVKTDAAFTVVAQSVGDYKPGGIIVGALLTAKTFPGYAYIVRQGLVAALLPIASRTAGGVGGKPLPLPKPFKLQPGDKVLMYVDV
jgi:hypothetical protein